jgi:hypothetical protein
MTTRVPADENDRGQASGLAPQEPAGPAGPADPVTPTPAPAKPGPIEQPAPTIDLEAPSATAPRQWRARVPNSHLGRISGRDKTSVYAVQLLFWREYRRKSKPDFVLSLAEAMKPPTKGGLGMSERAFTAGIKILVESGVLTRWQPNHRAPAQEKLAPAIKGEGYVELDVEFILYTPAKVVGFVAMVLLSPKLVHATDLARGYLDIRDHATINALVEKALAGGRIAGAKLGGRWLLCRPEMAPELVKNGAAKFRKTVTPTSEKRGHQLPKNGGTSIVELDGSSRTANGRTHLAAAASEESLGTNLAPRTPEACSTPSDLFDAAAAAELKLASEEVGAVLRRADLAQALARYLLLPGGLHGATAPCWSSTASSRTRSSWRPLPGSPSLASSLAWSRPGATFAA